MGEPRVGLPYAKADIDMKGYCVVCPECGARCRPTVVADEDEITKSAGAAYAAHYAEEHD